MTKKVKTIMNKRALCVIIIVGLVLYLISMVLFHGTTKQESCDFTSDNLSKLYGRAYSELPSILRNRYSLDYISMDYVFAGKMPFVDKVEFGFSLYLGFDIYSAFCIEFTEQSMLKRALLEEAKSIHDDLYGSKAPINERGSDVLKRLVNCEEEPVSSLANEIISGDLKCENDIRIDLGIMAPMSRPVTKI